MVKIACVLSNFYSTHGFQWVNTIGYVNIHNGQFTILWGIDCQKKDAFFTYHLGYRGRALDLRLYTLTFILFWHTLTMW